MKENKRLMIRSIPKMEKEEEEEGVSEAREEE